MMPVTINAANRPPVALVRTLVQHRRYIFSNAWQDFLHKYAGTGIGLLWNLVHPVMVVLVYSFVFTTIMPSRYSSGAISDVPYVLFLCSALLPWISFVDGLQRTTTTFVDNAGYLRKLAVPEEVFLAKTIVGSGILLTINMGVLVVAAILVGFAPFWTWLLMPVAGALMLALAFGLGAFFGTLNVFVKDISQIIAVATQLWVWLTPIIYASSTMPEWLRKAQFANPIFPFTELFRELFLFGRPGTVVIWLSALTWTALALLAGSAILRRFRSELRDAL